MESSYQWVGWLGFVRGWRREGSSAGSVPLGGPSPLPSASLPPLSSQQRTNLQVFARSTHTASLTGPGRLRISLSSDAPEPLILGQPSEVQKASKALHVCASALCLFVLCTVMTVLSRDLPPVQLAANHRLPPDPSPRPVSWTRLHRPRSPL